MKVKFLLNCENEFPDGMTMEVIYKKLSVGEAVTFSFEKDEDPRCFLTKGLGFSQMVYAREIDGELEFSAALLVDPSACYNIRRVEAIHIATQ